ncbi:MAG: ABC transporter permease, partial [Tissierellia bacterium]|nr:ABC transporter permease [Tissierellia bacterium]
MLKFIAKRTLYSLITLFLIITATFFLLAGAPGDPIAAKVEQMPEKAQEVIRAKYGLDRSVVERYFVYMKNLITTGDFGESIVYTGKSANDIIKENTLISAKIGIIA